MRSGHRPADDLAPESQDLLTSDISHVLPPSKWRPTERKASESEPDYEMESQRLMSAEDKGAVLRSATKPGDSRGASESSKKSAPVRNRSSGLMSVFSDFFSKKSRKDECAFLSVVVTCFLVLSVVTIMGRGVDASPVVPERQNSMYQFSPSARNIRHLPCISRRTKEEGICMFAIDCLKANGTHLGTCIDRFYFGSCCQMPYQLDPITDNHIEDNTIFGKPLDKIPLEHKVDNTMNLIPPTTLDVTLLKEDENSQSTSKPTTIAANSVKPSAATQTSTVSSQKPTYSSSSQKPVSKPSVASQRPVTATQKPNYSTKPSQKPYVSSQKPSSTSYKPSSTSVKPSQKPISSSQRPISSSQKPSSSSPSNSVSTQGTKPGTTTQITRRPSPGSTSFRPNNTYVTRKPVTTGYVVNNTKFTNKHPIKVNLTQLNDNGVKETVAELIPNIKPTRNNTITNISNGYLTTTFRPFYLPSRAPNSTESTTASHNIHTTVYINNQLYNTTKPAYTTTQKLTSTTRSPQRTTTDVPYKISTFQSVQGGQETKPTTTRPAATKKPFITAKPTTPKPGSDLPFGTKLPSSSSSSTPTRPSTSNNRPTYTSNQTTSSPIIPTTSTPTTQRPQELKPIQKPTPRPERPQRPIFNNSRPATNRPIVQRPQNSTLSNRRPTTTPKPTTVLIKKPTIPSQATNATTTGTATTIGTATTSKPTTTVYRPFSTKPSQRPIVSSQKPQQPTTVVQKPTTTIRLNTTSATTTPTTTKPVRISPNITTTQTKLTTTTKKPTTSFKPTTVGISTTIRVPQKPAVTPTTTTTQVSTSTTQQSRPSSNTSTRPSSTSTRPSSTSTRPSSTSTKPSTLPQSAQETKRPVTIPIHSSTKPSTTPQKVVSTTVNPLTNEVDDIIVQKPTVDIQKVPIATTEKVGLVTWTNFIPPSVTPSSVDNTTKASDDWSPITPQDGWVLLQTIVNNQTTGPTVQPDNTIAPSKKPVSPSSTTATPSPTSSSTLKPTTTPVKPETSTASTTSVVSSKPIFTVQITTRPVNKPKPANATTQRPDPEFSTFTSVSGGPSTEGSKNTTTEGIEDGNTTVSGDGEMTTVVDEVTTVDDTGNTTISDTIANTTVSSDDSPSTEKSTVSPIEGITSSGSPLASADSLNMSDYKDVCGRRLWPEARVVGGGRAPFGKWPWQVSLRQWRASTYLHKCGAALLSDSWAITAAHCVDSVPPSDLLLRLGEHDLASEEEPYGFQERRVQIVASHPQFDPRTFEYDLALLRFYEPVTFQPNILPVCVPTNDEGFVGKTAYVTGWGRLYEDGPLPSVLQEVSVPVLENAMCETMYRSAGYVEHIPHIFICAGWRKGGFDSCEGDSGGPMVLQRDDKRFLLAGVISWGIGCAEPNQPGVYTRISEFRDWINQILQF